MASVTTLRRAPESIGIEPQKLRMLEALARKVLWLSAWTIHNANHERPSRDGLKVGGHQASSASLATIMSALYFDVLQPRDRVAVKPHASPVFHAIQYLLGRQTGDNLQRFRALGGAQSYPSRTKDADDVDFSTGSVGLGVAMTSFASLVQDYIRLKQDTGRDDLGRMVALVGDAELDEGNVFEAMLEGWKHDVRNLWWVIDYNRQSLDTVVSDRLFTRFDGLFASMGWDVKILKYGRKLEAAFARAGGGALREWIDNCPNSLYSTYVYRGGQAWRDVLERDLGRINGIGDLLARHDDASLHALMTNLAGHDMESVLEAFHGTRGDRPTCFITYTVKGHGLPFAGHKDNHAGLMNPDQMKGFKAAMGIADGDEWDRFAGLDADPAAIQAFLEEVPFAQPATRRHATPAISVPVQLPVPKNDSMSTQEGFGRILNDIGREDSELSRALVTCSPDVTVSTNLGGWVNHRGVFDREVREDTFRQQQVVSPFRWRAGPNGQHIELGIAEHNLFLLLGALGMAGPLFGRRLLPIGTLYDPFVMRGLDALNYALYQDARFMVVATPSGLTLAPEGGAHQSIATPLIGMGLPNLSSFEPAFVDELGAIMRWSFEHMQDEVEGGSVYLRLSTRPLAQAKRDWTPDLAAAAVEGGYWLVPPATGCELAIAYMGAVAPEAIEAHRAVLEDVPGAGLLAITSADRLHAGWRTATAARQAGGKAESAIDRLLAPLSPDAALVTVVDGHPATLSWLGAVGRHRVVPLGVESFGQSGDVPDLYRLYGLDRDAILDAAAQALLRR